MVLNDTFLFFERNFIHFFHTECLHFCKFYRYCPLNFFFFVTYLFLIYLLFYFVHETALSHVYFFLPDYWILYVGGDGQESDDGVFE